MKISKKMLVLIAIIFMEGIFLLSIFVQYAKIPNTSLEIEGNIKFFEPSSELKYFLIREGKTIVLIYNYSQISIEKLEEIVNIFSGNVYFFLINSSLSQAFIISPLYEKTTFNLTIENIFRELCKLSLDAPKECIEII